MSSFNKSLNYGALRHNDVTWSRPISGKDSKGNDIIIQKCDNWINNDPKSCLNSPSSPKSDKWISCALGSSPGGIYPNERAETCGPISSGPTDFPCTSGRNCYAIISSAPNAKHSSSFMNRRTEFFNELRWFLLAPYEMGLLSCCVAVIVLILVIIYYKQKGGIY